MLERVIVAAAVAIPLAVRPPPPRDFLAVDAHRHRVTITLIASYDETNGGFNFDGYSRFLMWTVPRGWTVRVGGRNRGAPRHSCAGVHGSSSGKSAFPGASSPPPQSGLASGHTAHLTFPAAANGVCRIT